MDIPIDVEVLCTDGPGGHSSAIVLNPVTKEVTHFAVRTKGFLADEYLVPVQLIAESTPLRISLSCSRAELAQCQPFEKTVLVGVDGAEVGADNMDYALASSYVTMPGAEYPGPMMPPTLQEEQIPEGEAQPAPRRERGGDRWPRGSRAGVRHRPPEQPRHPSGAARGTPLGQEGCHHPARPNRSHRGGCDLSEAGQGGRRAPAEACAPGDLGRAWRGYDGRELHLNYTQMGL